MREFLSIAKALADENRVRAMMFLRGGELCLCQIIEMLRLAPSTVSRHMAILHQASLVDSRKEGRWVFYRLSDAREPVIQDVIKWAHETLAMDEQVVADAKAVRAVKKIGKEELCARYNRC